jgi:hypothetical protein
MKALLTIAILSLSTFAHAATYNCNYSEQTPQGYENKANFSFEPSLEGFNLGTPEGVRVSCGLMKTMPTLVTCTVGKSEKNAFAVVATNGTPSFGTSVVSDDKSVTLFCSAK